MPIDPSKGYPPTDPAVAMFAGDQAAQAEQLILDIDTAMRGNYALNIEAIGRVIYPILYAESTFDGGRYTLLVNEHTSFVKQNVSPIYSQCKAIAHIPLGIFSCMSGYAEYTHYGQFYPAIQSYSYKVGMAADALDVVGMPPGPVHDACKHILQASMAYMATILSATHGGTFDFASFRAYVRPLNESIGILQMAAAKDQIEVMSRTLREWKAMFTQEEWDRLYVVISAIWTLSVENAHELIIKPFMKPLLQETNVIVSEAAGTLDLARTLLGRIVGDRIMAAEVFDASKVDFAEDIYSLSTRRDLLSQAIEKQLPVPLAPGETAGLSGAACPHLAS